MRKVSIGLAVSALALAALSVIAPSASALVVGDVGVTSSGRPGKVSPPGGYVVYTATATNNGLIAIDVVLTSAASAGTVATVSQPGCAVMGGTAACTVSNLGPGQSFGFDVVLQTPFTEGSITNTVSASSTLNVDVVPGNNSASTSTPVVNDPGTSMAFVPGGDCLTYKTHTLCVPESSPGVFTVLNDALVAPGTSCGEGYECGPGVHLDFGQDPYYKALDPNDPLHFYVAFPNEDPCHGLGNPGCIGVAYRTQPVGPAARVPYCAGASATVTGDGRAVPTPCVNSVNRTGSPKYTYEVLLLSNDPDLLPPIRLVGG